MKRCTDSNTCPKFFLGLSGTEFWQLQGSPVLTDAYGFSDLAQPDNARIYYYSSTQHGGNGGTASITYAPSAGVYPLGTVTQHVDTFRALFIDLEDWVVRGIAPPASQVPKLADGTLVRPSQVVFPAMKGTTWAVSGVQTPIPDFQYLGRYNGFSLLDYGPQYLPQDESGIASLLPPYYIGRDYAILVPQVDPTTGVATPEALAKISTLDPDMAQRLYQQARAVEERGTVGEGRGDRARVGVDRQLLRGAQRTLHAADELRSEPRQDQQPQRHQRQAETYPVDERRAHGPIRSRRGP